MRFEVVEKLLGKKYHMVSLSSTGVDRNSVENPLANLEGKIHSRLSGRPELPIHFVVDVDESLLRTTRVTPQLVVSSCRHGDLVRLTASH